MSAREVPLPGGLPPREDGVSRRWVLRAGRLWRAGRRLARDARGGLLALDPMGVQLSERLFCALFGPGVRRPMRCGGFYRVVRRAGAVFYAVGGVEVCDEIPR